jgi:hypothetical protein
MYVHFSFPDVKEGKRTRRFQLSWLTKYHWLAYSEIYGGGFCQHCLLFPTTNMVGNNSASTVNIFVKKPLSKYKDATE